MARFWKFTFGFMLGGLIGAAAATLLAPYSGDKLRAEISLYFKKAADDIHQAAVDKRVEMEKQLDSLRSPQKEA